MYLAGLALSPWFSRHKKLGLGSHMTPPSHQAGGCGERFFLSHLGAAMQPWQSLAVVQFGGTRRSAQGRFAVDQVRVSGRKLWRCEGQVRVDAHSGAALQCQPLGGALRQAQLWCLQEPAAGRCSPPRTAAGPPHL